MTRQVLHLVRRREEANHVPHPLVAAASAGADPRAPGATVLVVDDCAVDELLDQIFGHDLVIVW